MTFVHGQTGSSSILSAPANTQQRLSELEQLLGITRQNTEQATELPVSRLRTRLGLTSSKTEPITEQLSNIENRLSNIERVTGVKEPSSLESSLDEILGTTKPITEQLEQHTRQLTELNKKVTELTEQLEVDGNNTASNTELDNVRDDLAKETRRLNMLESELANKAANSRVISLESQVKSLADQLGKQGAELKKGLDEVLNKALEHLKSLEQRLSALEGKAKKVAMRQPTGELVTVRLRDGRDHRFREYRSTRGLTRPHKHKSDLILGDFYIDLEEPED